MISNMNKYTIVQLDLLRLRLDGPFRECAEAIVEKADLGETITQYEYELAEELVMLAHEGKIG
jgi:hypothetical protein